MLLFPFGAMQHVIFGVPAAARQMGITRVFYREGLTETIQIFQRDLAGQPWFHVLRTNQHAMSSTTRSSQRYMKLYVYWPIAVRPDARDALLISYGVGSTAKALTDTKSLQSIEVVDISRDILEAGTVFFPDPGEHPLRDSRVTVHVEDGRFFLLTTPRQYDLITAEPPPPRHGGIGNLYSREYFALIRDRLNEGGVVTYWLPVYQLQVAEARAIVRAFRDIFPDCSLWTGNALEWMLVGTKGEFAAPSVASFSSQWEMPMVGAELRRLGFQSPEQFGSLFIADGDRLSAWLGDVLPLVDNYPQRLPSRPVEITPQTLAEYQQFMNEPAAAANFASSPVIGRIWPAELRAAARDHFRVRPLVDALLALHQPDLLLLHQALTDPLLAGYAGWALQGDGVARAIVNRISREALRLQPFPVEVWWNLAADAVDRHEFGLAARYLNLPFEWMGQPAPWWCVQIQIYLQLKSGATDRAEALRDTALADARSDQERSLVLSFYDWAQSAARTEPRNSRTE
jgi:hypothetical protein